MTYAAPITSFIDSCNKKCNGTAEIFVIKQKPIVTGTGEPLYLLPTYDWDKGSGFTVFNHNFKKYEDIDVMGGPGAVVFTKTDAGQSSCAYYFSEESGEAEAFIYI